MRFPVAVALAAAAGCSAPHRDLSIVPTLPACVAADAVNTIRLTAQGDFMALPGLTASASAMQDAQLSLPRETRVVDVQGFGPSGLAAFGRTAPLSLDDVAGGAIGLAYGPPDGVCVTASLQAARAGHHATLLASGAVLISGGYDDNGAVTSLELYLPNGDGAKPAAAFRTVDGVRLDAGAVLGHAVALLSSGDVLLSGGVGVDVASPTGESGIAFQGATLLHGDGSVNGKPRVLPGSGRAEHSATTLGDGRVLLAGGCAEIADGGCGSGRVLSTTLLYDPLTDSFSDGPRLVHARFGHSAILRGDGTVLIVGGLGEGGAIVPSEIFDPDEARGFDAGLSTGAAIGLSTGAVFVSGAPASTSNHAGLWLSATEAELPLPDLAVDAAGPPLLAALDDGGVLVVGDPSAQPQALVFDGRTDIPALAAPLPFAPGSLTHLGDGTVLVAGGRAGSGRATTQAAIYFRSPVSPYSSLPPLSLDSPSDPYLPRRPDRATAEAGQLVVSATQPLADGRPAEFALVAGMQVADFDFDLLAGRRGTATAALLLSWQSDASYAFVVLAPHQPAALWTVAPDRPGPARASVVAGCSGSVLDDGELPDGSLAHVHLSWRAGTLSVTSTRTLLSCHPAALARGQVGVGAVDGVAAFGNLSLSR